MGRQNQRAGSNGWLCKPQTFGTFGAKYIFIHTTGQTYIYIYIQGDKQDRTHGTRTCALTFHKIKTALLIHHQAMNHNHQPITKIGRHTRVKVTFWNMLPRYSPIHCHRENNYPFAHCPFPELHLSDQLHTQGMTVPGEQKAACLKRAPQPAPSPRVWTDSISSCNRS